MNACPHASKPRYGGALEHVQDLALSSMLLHDSTLRVRPLDEPIPRCLAGSLLGRQFEHWLRQRDDAARTGEKTALRQALIALSPETVRTHARRQAALARSGTWNHWIWATPLATTASLLGMPLFELRAQMALVRNMQALARGLSGDDVGPADIACAAILDALDGSEGPLQDSLRACAPPSLWGSPDNFSANRLALLWQSHEAGAALLGNALMRLSEEPSLRHRAEIRTWLIELVSAGDAVHSTRRVASRDFQIGGRDIAAGMAFMLDLGGEVGFGAGCHRCPGEDIALTAVSAALEWLIAQGVETWPAVSHVVNLPNARIPVFFDQESAR